MSKRKTDDEHVGAEGGAGAVKTKKSKYAPTDEFQQVSKESFVSQYAVDLGHGGQVYYQPDVRFVFLK